MYSALARTPVRVLQSSPCRVLRLRTVTALGVPGRRFIQMYPAGDITTAHIDHGSLPESDSEPFKVNLPTRDFSTHHCEPPTPELSTTKSQLLTMYEEMVEMRRMETSAETLYMSKLMRGFCHLSIGQEAISVGVKSVITKTDKLIQSYRCHPFAVMLGGSVKTVLAELMGREGGMSKGRGGSMHMFAPPRFYGGNGIVGSQVPLGTGLAFAQKYRGDHENASFIFYGDGGSNQGQVAEAFNIAKLWNLPAIFVCENNRYGMGTSDKRSSSNTEYYTRGDSHLIPGLRVNAMDVLCVARSIVYAKEWTKAGKGPLILEMVTYRYAGHSMSDPGKAYRTREEIQSVREAQDPIARLRNNIIDWGVTTEANLSALDKSAKASVDKEEEEEAKASPEPAPETLWDDIYVKGSAPMYMRGRERLEIHHNKAEDSDLYPDGPKQAGAP